MNSSEYLVSVNTGEKREHGDSSSYLPTVCSHYQRDIEESSEERQLGVAASSRFALWILEYGRPVLVWLRVVCYVARY
jgi:hypothetical protein